MWTKKSIALIALSIIVIFALVLPLNNVLADHYKFLTGTDGQEKTLPSDDEITTINNNSSNTEDTQSADEPLSVDNGVTPPTATRVQPGTTAQPPNQVQGAPEQPVQNTQPNGMYQPDHCAPMVPIPKDYKPKYEWYENNNSWERRSMGHH